MRFKSVMLCILGGCLLAASPAAVAGESGAAGKMEVIAPWARETAPRAYTGAVFMTLKNHSAAPDRLVEVSSGRAERAEVHETTLEGGIMRMRRVSSGLEVGGFETRTLEPGGHHIMLIGLREPLRRGDTFPLTLTFALQGEVEVTVEVRSIGATPPEDGEEDGHHHHHSGEHDTGTGG